MHISRKSNTKKIQILFYIKKFFSNLISLIYVAMDAFLYKPANDKYSKTPNVIFVFSANKFGKAICNELINSRRI